MNESAEKVKKFIKTNDNHNKNSKIENYFKNIKTIIINLNNNYKEENYKNLNNCIKITYENIINIVNKCLIFSINELILKQNNFKEKYYLFLNNIIKEISQSNFKDRINNKHFIINNIINTNSINHKFDKKKKNNSCDNSYSNKNKIKIKRKLELNNSSILNSNEKNKINKFNLKKKFKNNSVLNSNNNINTIDNTCETNRSYISYNQNNNLNFSFSSKKELLKITELNPISSEKLFKYFPFYKNRKIVVHPKPTNQTKNFMTKGIKILNEYKQINHKLSKSKDKK